MESRPDTVHHRTLLYFEAVRILEAEHGRKIDIDAVAERLSTSRRALQRAFREVGGTTFRERLTEVRMEHAVTLLGDFSLTIGAVTERVGYRQPAQFAKSFRDRFGCLPSEYRRQRMDPLVWRR